MNTTEISAGIDEAEKYLLDFIGPAYAQGQRHIRILVELARAGLEGRRAFERNGQGLDDDIETVRYTIGHLKATGHDDQTYIYRDLARVLRNLEAVRARSRGNDA